MASALETLGLVPTGPASTLAVQQTGPLTVQKKERLGFLLDTGKQCKGSQWREKRAEPTFRAPPPYHTLSLKITTNNLLHRRLLPFQNICPSLSLHDSLPSPLTRGGKWGRGDWTD